MRKKKKAWFDLGMNKRGFLKRRDGKPYEYFPPGLCSNGKANRQIELLNQNPY
jgi:hypothetical protein